MTVTSSQIVRSIEIAAEELGDFQYYGNEPTSDNYGAGYYVRYGKPSCMMGYALAEHFTIEEIIKVENKKMSKAMQILGVQSTEEHDRFLNQVQYLHDKNFTYAEAVELAGDYNA